MTIRDIDELYPSKFLSAGDLPPEGLVLTIADCERVTYADGKSQAGLTFRPGPGVPTLPNGKSKMLGLNTTNKNVLKDAYTKFPENWVGKPVLAYPTEVDFQGRRVAAVRLKIPRGRPAQSEPEPDVWDGDEPPFDDEAVADQEAQRQAERRSTY